MNFKFSMCNVTLQEEHIMPLSFFPAVQMHVLRRFLLMFCSIIFITLCCLISLANLIDGFISYGSSRICWNYTSFKSAFSNVRLLLRISNKFDSLECRLTRFICFVSSHASTIHKRNSLYYIEFVEFFT